MTRQPSYPHEVLAVVFRVAAGRLEALLWQRAKDPFADRWSLPGGELAAQERLGASLARHLADKVDVREIAYLEQLETRSDPDRDPRGRALATAYLGLVPSDSVPAVPPDTAWHAVSRLPPMAFDHGSIVTSARDRLRAKMSYTTIGFALMPHEFAIAALREVYVAVLGHDVSATNLQRVLLRRGAVVATGVKLAPSAAGGRPASAYRFSSRSLEVTDPFAVFRPPLSQRGVGRRPVAAP